MASDPVSEPKSLLKNPLLYSSAVLVVAALGVVFVMFSRWQESRNMERRAAQERAEKQHEQDRMAVEQLGGKEFAILSFYASPPVIRRGESAQTLLRRGQRQDREAGASIRAGVAVGGPLRGCISI